MGMKRFIVFVGSFLLVVPSGNAAQRSIPVGSMMEHPNTDRGMQRPQISKDLEGLDPREAGISQGLRGSFTIKHYIKGPWKGGTAVIELASDLSYAEIRIFDKEGTLQRIYSVQPKSQNAHLNPSSINNPMKMVEEADIPAQPAASESPNVTRSPEREAAVQAQTAKAMAADREERYGDAPRTVSGKAGDIREGSTQEAYEEAQRAAQAPRKKTIRVRKKRKVKHSAGLDTPLSGATSDTEYYYEDVVVVEKPDTPESRAAEKESRHPASSESAQPMVVASNPAARSSTPAAYSTGSPTPPAASPSRPAVPSVSRSNQPVDMHPAPQGSSTGGGAIDESSLPDVREAITENESESASVQAGKRSVASDQWKPKPTQVASLPGEPMPTGEMAPVPTKTRRQVPAEDLSEATKAAARMESENWTPKGPAPTPSDAELGLNNMPEGQSGGKRRSSKKGGRGVDEMVPMSDEVRQSGQTGAAGENWAPTTRSAKLSAQEEKAQAIASALKPAEMPRPIKVNRDVNNPEETVLPFYSLEKFSGAQFGRHREFERRVIYKQNKKSPVKGYDFYIDEVDRKQEKHYLYYYKIDSKKKAKLIATEKHEKVSFLGNYDIGSEDKGKIDKE
jgi:hypothetical protein